MSDTGLPQELSLQMLLIIFVAGGFLGDIAETIFCYLKYQKWMCRSSFVYGQISAVWGLAFVFASMLAEALTGRSVLIIFLAGAVLGSFFEYSCSVVLEKVFGVTFWDYSKFKYNLGGRINLQYSLFWGLATVIWIDHIYPLVLRAMEAIPASVLNHACDVLLSLLVVDTVLSIMALKRYGARRKGIAAQNKVAEYIDKYFSDERVEWTYPHMKVREEELQENPLSAWES